MNPQMSFFWDNLGDAADLDYSTQHPSFPAINVQHRWFTKPWRSKYGAESAWGLFRITATNLNIYFREGGPVLTAVLTLGDFDSDTLCTEIKTQMEAVGAGTYTVTYSDVTNLFTIAVGAGNYDLMCNSNQVNAAWGVIGMSTAADKLGAATYTSDYVRINTEEELDFDFGAATDLRMCIVKNHNLQNTAVIQIRYYSDAWITLDATDTIPWRAETMALQINRNYRYVRMRFVDVDNPDLYIEIGRVFFGEGFEPRYQHGPDFSVDGVDPSVLHESEDGQTSSIQLTRYKEWTYPFEGVYYSDRQSFELMFQDRGTSRALFVCENIQSANFEDFIKYIRFTSWTWGNIAANWKDEKFWESLEIGVIEER